MSAPKLGRLGAISLAVLLSISACGTVPELAGSGSLASPLSSPAAAVEPTTQPTTQPATQPAVSSAVNPETLAPGALYRNPVSHRMERIEANIATTAVLIGDSQSGGAAGVAGSDTWVQLGLAQQGYHVDFQGAGGTGFVAHNGRHSDYLAAINEQKLILPFGNPPLIVIQGGGNDASQGASNAQITSNAVKLVQTLKASYPHSKLLMIGTLAKGSLNGGGRRTAVDALLSGIAKSQGVAFISAGDWITRYSLTNDLVGVHLNAKGHAVLTKVLAARLQAMGLSATAKP